MLYETKQLLDQLHQDTAKLGGVVDLVYFKNQDNQSILSLVSLHLNKPATDTNCVAAIDMDVSTEKSIRGRYCFNTDIYNENLNISDNDFKKAERLQLLAVKYSHKFWQSENR